MSRETLNLRAAAALLHMDEHDLFHAAQRGEVAAIRLNGADTTFETRVLEEWGQRRLIALNEKKLTAAHLEANRDREMRSGTVRISEFFAEGAISSSLSARNKAGVLRDMTDLADSTGLLYDPLTLFAEMQSREEAGSTAIDGGVALLHPRYHDPYLFQSTFLALGRTERPVFFGAPEGEGTDIFFLICCADHALHLHILARLCLLSLRTPMLAELRAANDADEMRNAILRAEDMFFKGLKK